MTQIANPIAETNTINSIIDGKEVVITVRKLRWKDVLEVSNDIIAIIGSLSTGKDVNMISSLDKILKLVVTAKDKEGNIITVDDLPIDILGEVADRVYEINFTQSRSTWTPLINKLSKLVEQAQAPAQAQQKTN